MKMRTIKIHEVQTYPVEIAMLPGMKLLVNTEARFRQHGELPTELIEMDHSQMFITVDGEKFVEVDLKKFWKDHPVAWECLEKELESEAYRKMLRADDKHWQYGEDVNYFEKDRTDEP